MSGMELLIKNMNKKAKENIVQIGLSEYNYERIPFTSPRMNYCTYGGLPVGRLIEFYGEEHGGKTTSALDIVANYQRLENEKYEKDNSYVKRRVLWADCENTLDNEWATKLGVDVNELYILKPSSQSAEEIFEFINQAVDTGEIGLFVIDSLGVMVSAQALEKTIEEKTYAGISKPLTDFGNKVQMLVKRHKCMGIGINQIRDNLNSPYGGISTPGGKAWKHLCSVRLQFSRGKYLDENGKELTKSAESPAGNIVLMNMIKNKTCPPKRRVGQYSIMYDTGIDYIGDLIDVAIKLTVINKRGSYYDIIDLETGEVLEGSIQGKANLCNVLAEDEDLLEMVEHYVNEYIKSE